MSATNNLIRIACWWHSGDIIELQYIVHVHVYTHVKYIIQVYYMYRYMSTVYIHEIQCIQVNEKSFDLKEGI